MNKDEKLSVGDYDFHPIAPDEPYGNGITYRQRLIGMALSGYMANCNSPAMASLCIEAADIIIKELDGEQP